MKLLAILSLSSILCTTAVNAQSFSNQSRRDVKMHSIQDPNSGMIIAQIPLPGNWKVEGNAIYGPNGTEVRDFQGGSFSSLQGQIYSLDQIIRGQLIPKIQQAGAQVKGVIDLPSIARNDQQTYTMYWKAMPSQEYHEAKGIEFIDDKGKPALAVVHYTLSRSNYGDFAFYYMNGMSANTQDYEKAKKDIIYGLANMRPNPQYIAIHNQKEQQKSRASWSAHNQRMRSNQASYDSFQKTQQTLSEVNDIYYNTWKSTSSMNDQGHSKTIDGVWNQNAMVNPYSGNQMKMENNYKYYYMNSNGQYFGTNDALYNPSTDPRMNHTEWRKVRRPGN